MDIPSNLHTTATRKAACVSALTPFSCVSSLFCNKNKKTSQNKNVKANETTNLRVNEEAREREREREKERVED